MKNKNNDLEAFDENEELTVEVTNGTEEKALNFFQRYGKFVIIGAVAVVVVVAGWWYLSTKSAENEKLASVALSRIFPYYQNGEYMQALTGDKVPPVRNEKVLGLKVIADEYSGTAAGKLAAFYSGEALLSLNKAQEARAYFEKASKSESDAIKVGANAGLGACSEAENNFNEAVSYYEKAAEMSEEPGTKARYNFYAAMCYEKLGNKEKAIQIYKDIMNAREMNEFIGLAKSSLVRLGTIIE